MAKKLFAFFMVVCIALMPVLSVNATEAPEEDYDEVLENIGETIREPWPSSEGKICDELLEMFLFDVKGFTESLAFCDAMDQQAVIDLFLEEASDEELETLLLVIEKYYFSFMEKGSNIFHFPSESEGALLETLWFTLQYHFAQQPETFSYEKDNRVLFDRLESAPENEAEGAGYLCMISLKNDPVPFVKDLAKEPEETQQNVMRIMQLSVSTVKGAVVAEVLDTLPGTADFTEAEMSLLNGLRGLFEGIHRLEPAPGPNPEELAERNARKEAANAPEPTVPETVPEPTVTEPTVPETTVPETTAPELIPEEPDSTGSLWILLPAVLAALAAGFILGRVSGKKEKQ